MLEYFSHKKAKKHQEKAEKSSDPILNDEDEAFLQRITSQVEGTPPQLPERHFGDLPVAGDSQGNDAQLVVFEEAKDVPIPDIPDTPDGVMTGISSDQAVVDDQQGKDEGEEKGKEKGKGKAMDQKKSRWSFLRRNSKSANRKSAAEGLHSAAQGLATSKAEDFKDGSGSPHEAKKEDEEVTVVLEKLNLAAVNNRVFSISDESQELLRKFTLVFKDLVNGVPTAYHDLESLLTNSEDQLKKMHDSLPSFLQQLIEKLPSKFTSSLGPEVLAAAAEKQGLKSEHLKKGANAASKAGLKIKVPSLKDLVTKKGALIGMLRAIMNFLKTRFPAVMGMNVLWSLALSVLLLVCWYCHKRGREVRLEKERAVTEAEMEAIKAQVEADSPAEYNGPMTTIAPEGAPIDEVKESLEPAETTATPGHAGYAAGGSLANAAREDEKKAAEKTQPAET